jgi:hypothetical protein
MKKVTINVPEDKYRFFMELIESLGFDTDEAGISEAQKEMVRERIKNSKKEELLTWQEARGKLKLKG